MLHSNIQDSILLKFEKWLVKEIFLYIQESYPLWILVLEFCAACNLTEIQDLFEVMVLCYTSNLTPFLY